MATDAPPTLPTTTSRVLLRLYSSWFCPYAQRAWIALEYLGIPYEYVESLVVKENQDEGDHGYDKHPRLLEINPKGLVPTLELLSSGKVVTDSLDCVVFLDDLAVSSNENGETEEHRCRRRRRRRLVLDPSLAAEAREFDRALCSPFYRILMRHEDDERERAFCEFSDGVARFVDGVGEGGGFHRSSSSLTIVDVAVIPWLLRLCVLRRYRPSLDLRIALGRDRFDRLNAYVDRARRSPAVERTLCESEEELINVYRRYADGTARSRVGQAVRDGKEAHDV